VAELPETGLVRLDPSDRAQLEAFADLHEATLPYSVPVQFGRRFMTRFYFPKLVAGERAGADLFRFEGQWAGYNLYTKYPHTMLRDAIRRHFFFLCGFIPGVPVANPRGRLRCGRGDRRTLERTRPRLLSELRLPCRGPRLRRGHPAPDSPRAAAHLLHRRVP
jgi:hypothetical protein